MTADIFPSSLRLKLTVIGMSDSLGPPTSRLPPFPSNPGPVPSHCTGTKLLVGSPREEIVHWSLTVETSTGR